MENFLRTYGWALKLALIAIGATLVALMVNHIAASQLAPYTVPELADMTAHGAPSGPRPKQGARAQRWDTAIGKLCLFGCPEAPEPKTCPEGCEDGEVCEDGECVIVDDQPAARSDVPVLSDLDMKLMGAMVADQAGYSMALLRDDSSNKTLVASPGDMIAEGAELVEIRRDRIILRRDGQLEYVRMNHSIGGEPSATPVSTHLRRPSTRRTQLKAKPSVRPNPVKRRIAAAKDVEKVNENHFQIERSAIEEKIDDRKKLARQGRVVPNYNKKGDRDGLKLVGISPSSVYSRLGIQSGDVIQSVNGEQINTSQEAMELFDQIRHEDKVTLEVERRGKKQRIEYDIR